MQAVFVLAAVEVAAHHARARAKGLRASYAPFPCAGYVNSVCRKGTGSTSSFTEVLGLKNLSVVA